MLTNQFYKFTTYLTLNENRHVGVIDGDEIADAVVLYCVAK